MTTPDPASPLWLDAAHQDPPTVYSVDFGGTETEQRLPPRRWRPAAATDAELTYYAIPARPTGTAALDKWEATWDAGYGGFEAVDMCTSGPAQPLMSTATTNWAGLLAVSATNYTQAAAVVGAPGFDRRCGSSAILAAFVGLGTSRLLQNGFVAQYPGAPKAGGPYPLFWEAIGPGHVNSPVFITTDFLRRGDPIALTTSYTPGRAATFTWHNRRTGRTVAISVSRVAGQPISLYYDGSSADFISENVAHYAATMFNPMTWTAVTARRGAGASVEVGRLPRLTLFSRPGHVTTIDAGSGDLLTASSFRTRWRACR